MSPAAEEQRDQVRAILAEDLVREIGPDRAEYRIALYCKISRRLPEAAGEEYLTAAKALRTAIELSKQVSAA